MVREAFLLAGGTGRRLGRDKRFIEFAGRLLYRHQLHKLTAVFETVSLLCKAGEEGSFDYPGVEVIGEKDPERALLCGLVSGLAASRGPAAFFLGVDLPLMPVEALQWFRDTIPADRAVIPRTAGRTHFACALYPKGLLPLLEQRRRENTFRLTEIFRQGDAMFLGESELPFLEGHPRAFLNVNSPDDLAAAEDPAFGA